MISTEGIIIKSTKYGDTSLILNIFTATRGLMPIMIKGVRSNLKSGAQLLNPGSYLSCLIDYNAHRNFQYFKEFKPAKVFWNTQGNIIKNCVLIFCIEVLGEILVEGDEQPELFDFIIEFFDRLNAASDNEFKNYPFYFLSEIAKFLGYQFDQGISSQTPYFNIYSGTYESSPSAIHPIMDQQESELLFRLVHSTLKEISTINLNGKMRQYLQDIILLYLQTHTPYFKTIHSLAVLRAILN